MPGEVADALDLAEPRRAHERRDRLGLALADLERERTARARAAATRRRIDVEAVGPPNSASGGSWRATSGASGAPVLDVGRVGDDGVERLQARRAGRRATNVDVEPEPLRVGARDVERVRR